MARGKITTDEWRAELQRLGAIGDGDKGKTTTELSVTYGVSLRVMQRLIREGVAQGRYIKGWASREDELGRRQRVPVYRLKEGAK